MPSGKSFLSEEERKKIAAAIHKAEATTSGEIKVYLEKFCDDEVKHRAWKVFYQLKMEQTEARTGILIYVAYKEKVFAVIGDEGISKKVPADFWKATIAVMQEHFKQGNFAEGLIKGIQQSSEQLHKHFPATENNRNELSDDVVMG